MKKGAFTAGGGSGAKVVDVSMDKFNSGAVIKEWLSRKWTDRFKSDFMNKSLFLNYKF